MRPSLDTVWRVFFSVGLLGVAVSCNGEFPTSASEQPAPVPPVTPIAIFDPASAQKAGISAIPTLAALHAAPQSPLRPVIVSPARAQPSQITIDGQSGPSNTTLSPGQTSTMTADTSFNRPRTPTPDEEH